MAAALVTLALAGCGGSTSPKDQVKAAWNSLKDSFVNDNPSELCSLLSSQSTTQLINALKLTGSTATDCKSAAKVLLSRISGQRSRLQTIKLLSVSVSGNTATTTDSGGGTPARWVKEGGGWKLSNLGS